jgi:hypothetical protein
MEKFSQGPEGCNCCRRDSDFVACHYWNHVGDPEQCDNTKCNAGPFFDSNFDRLNEVVIDSTPQLLKSHMLPCPLFRGYASDGAYSKLCSHEPFSHCRQDLPDATTTNVYVGGPGGGVYAWP